MTGYGLAILASILWGLTYCLDERVLVKLPVLQLYFLHCVFGAIVTGAILSVRGGELIRVGDVSKPFLGLTLVISTLASLAILGAIKLLGAAPSSVLEISYPLFVVIFSIVLFGGSLSWPVVVGGILIFAGATVVSLMSSG